MSRQCKGAYLTIATLLSMFTSCPVFADANGQSIKNIYVNSAKQIVVELEKTTEMPQTPHMLDLPGTNHRIVFDFCGASFEKSAMPAAETLTLNINKLFQL
jgi:hypothetical protein